MRYFRREWSESRGDDYDDWGRSIWFFETDDLLLPLRQFEEYANGNRLRYDATHAEDEFGALGQGRVFPDDDDETQYEISADVFEDRWNRGRRIN